MSKAAALDMEALLSAVPVANQAVRPQRNGRTLVLMVPVRKRWYMGPPISWLPGVHFRDEKGVALDALGEEVWGYVDGRRTTEEVIEAFAARHKLRFHEARLSVMAFLRMLMERNLIALVGREDGRGRKGPS